MNLPEKPYIINYPFAIEYDSSDSSFMCIKYEIKETIVWVDGLRAVPTTDPEVNKHTIPGKSPKLNPGGSIEYRIRSKIAPSGPKNSASVKWRSPEGELIDTFIVCDSRLKHGNLDGFDKGEPGKPMAFNVRVPMFLKGSEVEFSYYKWKDEFDELETVPEAESEVLPLVEVTEANVVIEKGTETNIW